MIFSYSSNPTTEQFNNGGNMVYQQPPLAPPIQEVVARQTIFLKANASRCVTVIGDQTFPNIEYTV